MLQSLLLLLFPNHGVQYGVLHKLCELYSKSSKILFDKLLGSYLLLAGKIEVD